MILERIGHLSDLMDIGAPSEEAPSGPVGFDDAALVARILESGSNRHFRLLIQRHQQALFDLVSSVLGPHYQSRAEEITQDAFLKIYRKLDTFRGEARFSTWAYRIAYNTALDRLRALRRRPLEVDYDEVTNAAPSREAGPQASAIEDEDRKRLHRAVDRLPDLYRTLIHLHYWRGFSVNEIAEILHSRPGTIKSYLHRARGRLERTLDSLTAAGESS